MQTKAFSSDATGSGLITVRSYRRRVGVSATTIWRWTRKGWLHPFNISGKPYLNADDIRQFEARAAAGEFSKSLGGALKHVHP